MATNHRNHRKFAIQLCILPCEKNMGGCGEKENPCCWSIKKGVKLEQEDGKEIQTEERRGVKKDKIMRG